MSGGAPVISVSVSEASDLGRLGFLPDELDRVLAALITPLIHGGFRIAYGGRLEGRGNFTTQMSARVAETYVPHALILGARPFIHVLAPHRVAALPRESLLAHAHILGAHAELWLMGAGESVRGVAGLDTQEVNGTRVVGVRCKELSGRPGAADGGVFATSDAGLNAKLAAVTGEAAESVAGNEGTAPSFSRMLRAMAELTDARIIVGGRTAKFSGPISGVTEEAVATIDAGKPLLVLGAFGGAARDIAVALHLLDGPVGDVTDERYRLGISFVQERESKYRQLMRDAGLEPLATELAGADTHTSAARLAIRILRHIFGENR